MARSTAPSSLGIAHGWAGLLYVALRWHEVSGCSLPSNIEERLAELARLGRAKGDSIVWMSHNSMGGAKSYYMPGWCNGTAGMVFLWLRAHAVLTGRKYLELAQRSGRDVLNTDGGNASLCCGLCGQAYALLALYRSTGDKEWLIGAERAAHLASKRFHKYTGPHRASLYKGELALLTLREDIRHPMESAMPFFEPEGWAWGS